MYFEEFLPLLTTWPLSCKKPPYYVEVPIVPTLCLATTLCTIVERFIYLFYFYATNETFVIKSIVIMRIHSYVLKYVLTIGIYETVFFIYFLLHIIVNNNFRMGCNSDEGRCFTVAVCV